MSLPSFSERMQAYERSQENKPFSERMREYNEKIKPPEPEEYGPKRPTIFEKLKAPFQTGEMSRETARMLALQSRTSSFPALPVIHPKEAEKLGVESTALLAAAPLGLAASAASKAIPYIRPLARIIGSGVMGGEVSVLRPLLEGEELPTAKEIAKEAGIWAAIDAGLGALGLGVRFGSALRNIQKDTGVPYKDLIKRLWEESLYRTGIKARPVKGKIVAPDNLIEDMVQTAEKEAETITGKAEVVAREPVVEELPKIGYEPLVKSEPVDTPTKPTPSVPKSPEKRTKSNFSPVHNRKSIKRSFTGGHAGPEMWGQGSNFVKDGKVIHYLYPPSHGGKNYIGPFSSRENIDKFDLELQRRKLVPIRREFGKLSPEEQEDILKKPEITQLYQEIENPPKSPIQEKISPKTAESPQNKPKLTKEAGNFEIKERDGQKVPVEGTVYSHGKKPLIGIHENHAGDWAITHIPSGMGLKRFSTEGKARAFVSWLEKNAIHDFDKAILSDPREAIEGFDREAIKSYEVKKAEKAALKQSKKPLNERQLKEKLKTAKSLPPLETKATQQTDISKPKLEEQKQYFLSKIDQILADPPNKPYVDIKIPDDGSFRVRNDPDSLALLKKRVQKDWPKGTTTPKKMDKVLSNMELAAKKFIPQPPEAARKVPVIGQKQSAKRSEIIKLFQKAFNHPIRFGKFKSKLGQFTRRGLHKIWPQVTRLLRHNDVETAAHEIGHYLHTLLYAPEAQTWKEAKKSIHKALTPFMSELKPISRYAPHDLEGFAEFVRMYVTNPEAALKLAPKFYASFENDMQVAQPEMLNALKEAREYYDTYIQGTPESRIEAHTSYGDDKGETWLNRIFTIIKDPYKFDKAKTYTIDRFFPAKRMVADLFGIKPVEVETLKDINNIYRLLRLLSASTDKAEVFLQYETFDPNTLKRIGPGLKSILDQLPTEEEFRLFNNYLIARRTIELQKYGIETGINPGDAQFVVNKYGPQFDKLANQWDKWFNSLLEYAVKSDLISPETAARFRSRKHYAPLLRDMGETKTPSTSTEKLQARSPFRRIKGSERDIIAPVESAIKMAYDIIINSEKNRAGLVLANLSKMKGAGKYVERVPSPIKLKAKISKEDAIEMIQKHLRKTQGIQGDMPLEVDIFGQHVNLIDIMPDEFLRFGMGRYPKMENIITVFREGKPEFYEVSPDIYQMWNQGIDPYRSSLIVKILRVPAAMMRYGAVMNPKFQAKNIVRDTFAAGLFSRYDIKVADPVTALFNTIGGSIGQLATAIGKNQEYVEWLKAGGSMGTLTGLYREGAFLKLEEMRKGVEGLKIIPKFLENLTRISEEVPRLTEMAKGVQVESDTRLGKEIAAYASRDLSIDYLKGGLYMRAINQIIPFTNATIQGAEKFMRELANPDTRGTAAARMAVYVGLPSLLLWLANRNDDRIEELTDREKDFNFIFFVGNTAVKIPVPFEPGVVTHALTQRFLDFAYKGEYDIGSIWKQTKSYLGSVADSMLPNFIPTLFEPIFETWANKDLFTGRAVIPPHVEDILSRYQYKTYGSSLARLIGRALSYMPGISETSKASSPAVIDHFINSWTAGLGRNIVGTLDYFLEKTGIIEKFPLPEKTIVERLGLDAFTTRYPKAQTKSIEEFYENYRLSKAYVKTLQAIEKGRIEEPGEHELIYKKATDLFDIDTMNRAYEAIQNCQKSINAIYRSPDITPKEKRKFIDDMYLQQIEFARAANKQLKEYRQKP